MIDNNSMGISRCVANALSMMGGVVVCEGGQAVVGAHRCSDEQLEKTIYTEDSHGTQRGGGEGEGWWGGCDCGCMLCV